MTVLVYCSELDKRLVRHKWGVLGAIHPGRDKGPIYAPGTPVRSHKGLPSGE